MDRFTDRSAAGVPSDFARRKRHGRFPVVFAGYVIAWLIVMGFGLFRHKLGDGVFIGVSLIVTLLIILSLVTMQRLLDLVMSIEFQNAIFTSSLTQKFDFTIVIDRGGVLSYYDQGFKRFFPDISVTDNHIVEKLLQRAEIIGEKQKEIIGEIYRGNSGHFVIDVAVGERSRRLFVHYTPISRPTGFFILQGRAFVERRGHEVTLSGNPETLVLLQNALLHTLEEGMFATDVNGHLIYANPSLMEWLGYPPSELLSQHYTLSELIYEADMHPLTALVQDFDGERLLRRHNGSLLRCQVAQRVISDPAGTKIGMIGHLKRKAM